MSEHDKWQDIGYLKNGNIRQAGAYRVLTDLNIMPLLKEYSPILTGTIPIGIDIPSSDLDIICEVSNFDNFKLLINKHWGGFPFFIEVLNKNTYIASFKYNGFEIEIFAQDIPSLQQNAYRHLVIEHRILNLADLRFKEEIIQLKLNGYKTEPAFGKLLNLQTPFEELLQIYECSDEELTAIIWQNGY